MYGPKWPFLLMYGSHDMRHTGFPRVDRLSTGPSGFRASHNLSKKFVTQYMCSFKRKQSVINTMYRWDDSSRLEIS